MMNEYPKCPNCGNSSYIEHYCTRTLLYCPPVWENGVNKNPDSNIETHYCTCKKCRHKFHFEIQYDKIINIVDDGEEIPVPTLELPINATGGTLSVPIINEMGGTLSVPTAPTPKIEVKVDTIERLANLCQELKEDILELKKLVSKR